MIEPKPTMSLLTAEVALLKAQIDNLHQQDRLKTREINTLVPENRNLIAQRDELLAALQDLFALIDENTLVRNIEDDTKPDWAMRQLKFAQRLATAHAALAKTAPVNPNAGVVAPHGSQKGRWTP